MGLCFDHALERINRERFGSPVERDRDPATIGMLVVPVTPALTAEVESIRMKGSDHMTRSHRAEPRVLDHQTITAMSG